MQWLTEISPWHWASLGVLLLISEILGAAGFLIGSAIAAFLMSAIMIFAPELDWKWQLVVFSSTAVVFSFIYLKRFSSFNEETDQPALNKRAAMHIGKKVSLLEATANGMSKVQIGDTRWKVQCDKELEAGAVVNITAADGMTLIVTAAENQ